ncbi:MAG: hypothetical protein ACQES8_01295 [Thermodesulfobacteriota bacterium]
MVEIFGALANFTKKTAAAKMVLVILAVICLGLTWPGTGLAANSIITTGEGVAALGNNKSRNETMAQARSLARHNAAEKAAAYIKSSTEVEDFTLKKDLVKACSEAVVTILEEMESRWLNDPRLGESYRIVIKAEVTPASDMMRK